MVLRCNTDTLLWMFTVSVIILLEEKPDFLWFMWQPHMKKIKISSPEASNNF